MGIAHAFLFGAQGFDDREVSSLYRARRHHFGDGAGKDYRFSPKDGWAGVFGMLGVWGNCDVRRWLYAVICGSVRIVS